MLPDNLKGLTMPAKKLDAGVQLYSFREAMLKDAAGTLKKIAALGIKQIESAGSEKGSYYGLMPKEMNKICKDLGMTLRSGHVHITEAWSQTLDEAAESGQEYLVCSSFTTTGDLKDCYKKTAALFNKCAEECRKRNIKFAYHNHDFEFDTQDAVVLYDILLQETDPSLVHMEFDLGWVIAAGKKPVEYFKKYPGRFKLWHLKDMDVAQKRSTEFGKGSLDIEDMFKHAALSGMECYFIEQEEYAVGPFESMAHNLKYLKKLFK